MSKYINSGTGRRTVGNSDAGILRVFVHGVCVCVCVRVSAMHDRAPR